MSLLLIFVVALIAAALTYFVLLFGQPGAAKAERTASTADEVAKSERAVGEENEISSASSMLTPRRQVRIEPDEHD